MRSTTTETTYISTDIPLEDLESDVHRVLYRHWLEIRGTRLMPFKNDFKPSVIARILPNILMLEVHHSPLRFKVRLTGTEVDDVMRMVGAGHWLDEFPQAEPIIARYTKLVEDKTPYQSRGKHIWPEGHSRHYAALTVPLTTDGEHVDYIVSAIHYFSENRPM